MVAPKINVKEFVNDGEIDLSMLNLQEVPVKEIASVKKAHGLDLSNNHLVTLPKTFPTLVNLIKIDLSRNELKELPENFGDLVKLKHLDLYKNQLQHLPLSFSKLSALRWLDLKDNPLVPSIAEVAGHCLDAKQCQKCAKDIVTLYSKLQLQIEEEKKSREEQRQKSIEEHTAKLKQEKKNKKSKAAKKQTEKVVNESKVANVSVSNSNAKKVAPIKTQKESGYIASFISFVVKFLSLLLLLFSVIMILITGTKFHYGAIIEDNMKQLVLNTQLPPWCKDTVVLIGEHLFLVQEIIHSKAVELFGSHSVNIVWIAFTGVYRNVTHAGSEFYFKIFGK